MPRTEPPSAALDRWLAAERSGLDADAEAAFAELLGGLPRPAPPAGFADRVLARARPPAAAHRGRRWRWALLPSGARGLAGAAAALLSLLWLLAALAASWGPWKTLAPAAIRSMRGAVSISGLLQAGIDAVMAAGQWLAGTVNLGDKLLLLARALAEPLATPPVAILAAACLLVSGLALRFLHDLIQRDRRWVYVDPI